MRKYVDFVLIFVMAAWGLQIGGFLGGMIFAIQLFLLWDKFDDWLIPRLKERYGRTRSNGS